MSRTVAEDMADPVRVKLAIGRLKRLATHPKATKELVEDIILLITIVETTHCNH